MKISITPLAFTLVGVTGLTLLLVNPSGRQPPPPPVPTPSLVVAPTVAPVTRAAVPAQAANATARPIPDVDKLPDDVWGRSVRLGQDLLARTYALVGPEVADPAMRYAGNNLSCSNCHINAGAQHVGLSLVGVSAAYPRYDPRRGRVATLDDRINDCMTRSMNGRPFPYNSDQMRGVLAYLKFLSTGTPVGSGVTPIQRIPELTRAASPENGAKIFAQVCAPCHGANGLGQRNGVVGDAKGYQFPPLWGPDSFNDGAGMDRLIAAANFVHGNMPAGATPNDPLLSVESAWDVVAYFASQPRPRKGNLAGDYPVRSEKPIDAPYGPYADNAPESEHKYGPFGPLRKK